MSAVLQMQCLVVSARDVLNTQSLADENNAITQHSSKRCILLDISYDMRLECDSALGAADEQKLSAASLSWLDVL
jgi:hypothetical protein